MRRRQPLRKFRRRNWSRPARPRTVKPSTKSGLQPNFLTDDGSVRGELPQLHRRWQTRTLRIGSKREAAVHVILERITVPLCASIKRPKTAGRYVSRSLAADARATCCFETDLRHPVCL